MSVKLVSEYQGPGLVSSLRDFRLFAGVVCMRAERRKSGQMLVN
jgi:hypothetical protein